MTPQAFIEKWRDVELKERSASQSHFNDLCRLLDVLDPTSADPKGTWFTFEKGASKTSGGEGCRCVARELFRLGIQGQAQRPERRTGATPAICAGAGQSAAADCL
jgi:hypothetical protein